MKCIVLAAGYATRLYPLTENFPKPLLDVKEKSILDWLMEDIKEAGVIDEVIVVSNHKFYDTFMKWADDKRLVFGDMQLTILDDGSTENDNRLGAVRDIAFAIKECDLQDKISSDNDGVLVIAGDNLLDFSIKGFLDFYKDKKATCIMRHFEPSVEKLQRTGVVEVDGCDKVISMEEKPQSPKSNWAVPPFYIYTKDDLGVIVECVNDAHINLDAPGGFIEWFCKRRPVYAYEMPGKRYDIGNKESLEWIRGNYAGLKEEKFKYV